jgi:hypothetical protein
MEFKDSDLAGVVERVLAGRVLERRQPGRSRDVPMNVSRTSSRRL